MRESPLVICCYLVALVALGMLTLGHTHLRDGSSCKTTEVAAHTHPHPKVNGGVTYTTVVWYGFSYWATGAGTRDATEADPIVGTIAFFEDFTFEEDATDPEAGHFLAGGTWQAEDEGGFSIHFTWYQYDGQDETEYDGDTMICDWDEAAAENTLASDESDWVMVLGQCEGECDDDSGSATAGGCTSSFVSRRAAAGLALLLVPVAALLQRRKSAASPV